MRNTERLTIIASLLLAASWAPPAAAELLFHQGFETCWIPGKTKPQFLEAMRTSIDGTSACIPQQSGSQTGISYTFCAVANGCGAGINGCPVSISAGTFSGDFQGGQFTAPGTANNITVPITTSVFPSCSVSLNAISMAYSLDYLMQTDGIDGVYSADLMPPGVEIANYTLTNVNCDAILFSLIGANLASAVGAAEENASAAIEPALRSNTVGQAVCPLSAP